MNPRCRLLRWLSLTGILLALSTLGISQQSTAPETAPPTTASDFSNARKLMQQGKMEEAMTELQGIEARDPGAKGLAFEMGAAYYKKGDYPKATEYLKRVTAADPANNEATQLLGLSYYLMGHPADAVPLLERVQGWYPRANVDAAYILGTCYIQLKNYDQARKSFGRMFDVPGDSAAAYLFTARMLLRQDYDPIAELYTYKSRIPEAIAEFQKEMTINPGNAATYYKLADAYSRVQKYDEAERLLQRSIWLDATTTGPYILMGKVLEKKGEPELAARALQHAASMDPNNPTTHHLLGQAYRDMGRKQEAESELQLAEQLQSRGKN
jgi:tetratricopeptide (TPR) repeat protein